MIDPQALRLRCETILRAHAHAHSDQADVEIERATITLLDALDESLKLQSHYALLLNMRDGGERLQFDVESWLARLASGMDDTTVRVDSRRKRR